MEDEVVNVFISEPRQIPVELADKHVSLSIQKESQVVCEGKIIGWIKIYRVATWPSEKHAVTIRDEFGKVLVEKYTAASNFTMDEAIRYCENEVIELYNNSFKVDFVEDGPVIVKWGY